MNSPKTRFRDAFLNGETLIGSFLKIANTQPAEILGAAGYDFVVVDEEHAPFSRESTDRIILACKAWDIAALVRVQGPAPEMILSVLDCGADGVLVPHVDSAEKARAVVSAARYAGGARGYSPTTRAGGFGGARMQAHTEAQDARVTVIAMIEDVAALDHLDEIMAVDGLDGIFIGRGDLTVAMGQSSGTAAPVVEAVGMITDAARRAGKAICVMSSSASDMRSLAAQGATAFITSSDQTLLKSAAAQGLEEARAALAST
ncbi:HpcH/HpaI aldolase family protein [Mameliella alba]|uniref:HpcH/HpaI aldolase family protein n=1 Tax=Mameliella alba TaxID=561184 RepID=UPI000B52ECF0|nr:aldolase/citrate lyase family protein [Mameliella alba]OWV46328.1 aldolase [Mameliella alba]GGF75522.1 aldolase [Mameliella alba]